MDIKLLLLLNCAIVVNCQSTISKRNVATYECEPSIDTKSEMESIRQLLMNLQQSAVRNEKEIRQIMRNQQNSDETQTMQEIKSITEDIRQRTDAIHEMVLKQHDNETQTMREMKSETDEICQIIVKQHGNETQTMQVMKSRLVEIRKAVQEQNRPRKGLL